MNPVLISAILAVMLFFGMLLLMEVGWRMGRRRITHDPDGAKAGTGVVEGAIFALFGLLVAFTFSGAAARFEARRHLVVEEANNIGTAYLRLDLLPSAAQPPLRDSFRRYLDARLETYRLLPDVAAAMEAHARSLQLQSEIWTKAVAACQTKSDPATTMLVLAALNAMIDVSTTRTAVVHMHPPPIIYLLLFAMGLGGALLAGYNMAGGKSRSWVHVVGFAAITAITVYVTLDIEYPRMGLIRVDAVDQVLVDLRETMQ